jgi:hypothetical protein
MNTMDAAAIIAEWKRRLAALAESPEAYRYTPPELVERHRVDLTTFVGYPEPTVAEAEEQFDVRFPEVFRQYLLEMARHPGGLFCGSDRAGPGEFEQFRTDALELMSQTDPALTLPRKAVVFLFHQGYTFVYLLAAGGFDGPPMQWTELEPEPCQVAGSFAEMVDAELRLMETNVRSSAERALGDGGSLRKWWQFWR